MKEVCSESIRGCEREPLYAFKLKSGATEDSTTKDGETYKFCLKHAFLESIRHTYWSNEKQDFVPNFMVHNAGLLGIFRKRIIFEIFAQEILKLVFENHRENPKVFGAKTIESGDVI